MIKNNIIKIIKIFFLFLLCFNLVNSVTVVENSPNVEQSQEVSATTQALSGAIGIGLFIGLGIGSVILIIWLIVRKIKENQRKQTDLLFSRFSIELKNCNQNRDSRLKSRSIKTFGLTF